MTLEPTRDAVTSEPVAEAGNWPTADYSDSDDENGVEESKSEFPPATPTPLAVEPTPLELEPDLPAIEPYSPAAEPYWPAE